MATVSPLLAVLSADEFQSLGDPVRSKLEDYLKKYDNDSQQSKIQYAKLQTQSEQQCFELDSQLQQLQEKGHKEEALIQELTDGKARLEAELHSAKEQLGSIQSKLLTLEVTCQDLKKEKDTLVVEKEDLSLLLSRRNDDLDRLAGELKTLTDQLVHANKEKSEALIKTEEVNSKQLALEYKEKRLDQERELIIRQQRLLQEELDARTKEVMNIRREKTSKVLELQTDVSEKIEELRIAQKTIAEMTASAEAQEKHIKELNDKVKELSETEMKMSENNRNELRSQMRLCELYKASSEDAQAKAEELTKATEELQRLLRDASVRFGELETDSKAQIDHYKQQLQKSEESNAELKKELERANTLLDVNKSRLITEESIEAMSPSAAAASRLLKSGMTLTQIYSQYVSVSEQLLIKDEENKRLNSYIDQILQEIEDRAPTIARQREDYEKSVEMVANLTRQLDLAVEEAEVEKENALEARRMLGQAQRNSQRVEKQVTDLSKQVCFLVREVEELKGNRMRDAPEDEVSSSEGSAAAVISRHLVTFRDVEELQQRNQMLLTSLREVTEKQDEVEQNAVEDKTAKIQQALENALTEVEHLRDTRRRHEELMESIIQQRDMYRMLLRKEEGGMNESRSPSKFRDLVSSTPGPAKPDGGRIDIERELNDSKIRLQEKESHHQSLLKEKKETEKSLNDKIQALQDQLADLRAQNVRLGTQIQYADEKEKLLQGNLDSYKKQNNSLEEKNKMYACTVAKHEQSIAVLRDEAMNAQQQLARAEVNVSMLQEEKQLLKDAEQRLLVERDSLMNERRSQSLLHVNLESIKLNLERNECETRMRLQNSVTSLEQQVELLRKKLDLEEERYRETVKTFETRLEADRNSLKAAEERAIQAEAKLSTAQEMLAAAESRPGISSPTRKVQVARLLSTTGTSTPIQADNDLLSELRTQLAQTRTEAASTQEQLELTRQQVEQYKAISDSMEEELKKSNEAAGTFKQETEQLITKLNEERDTLTKDLQEARDKLKALEEGAAILGQTTADQSEEVSQRVTRLEAELASATDQLKQAVEQEARARQDSLEQAKLAKEAQEKYERELVQHAGDVEQLNIVREQTEQFRAQLAAANQTLARVEQELETGRTSWETQKEMLEKELSEKSRRCSELDKQVDLMQQQIVTLSARMAAATRVQEIGVKSSDESNTSLNVSIGEEESRTADQLLELVRFLRREKEIAISRSEVQEAEAQRLKTQLESAERQLADVQAALHQERERSTTSSLTSEKHTEMLRRLETLNALTDSNRLLRDERVNLMGRVEEMTAKIASLEVELEPLRASNLEATSKMEELSAETQTLRKQVTAWRARTNALQERAGRATSDEVKRLQTEKEQVQKQLEQLQKQMEQMKEGHAKTAALLTETQRTNTQLITAQQKLQEEARKAKEDAQKLQTDVSSADAKREDEAAKAIEQANQLRRIARKYKTQYEELKVEHDKIVAEKTAADAVEPAPPVVDLAIAQESAARLQETEERITQLTAELEQIKQENLTLRTNDERTKGLLKTTRQKLALLATLTKEKEALTAELAESKAKIETLEQSSEELNNRTAALRSQLEGRLARIERENGEMAQAKQALECELESLNQRLPILQRQLEVYQKQQAPQTTSKPPSVPLAAENPPTANIKPMASAAVATQRPPVTSSPGQSASIGPRTTPTASIRPMAVTTSRTAAVQPTSMSVSPMAPPLIAIAAPNVREEEPGPSEPSTGAAKRARGSETEESPQAEAKRTRLVAEEEIEVTDVLEIAEEAVELATEDEEQQQEENEEVEEEEDEEGLIESEAEVEDEEEQVEEDEIIVEEQREDVEEQEVQPVEEESAPEAPEEAIVVEQAPAEELLEPEAFAATTAPPPAIIRPPPREDRLPSFGRSTLAFEDTGDDGIVPSTPVLFRPRTNDGFAEAVSSPHVNTRFVFGTVPDMSQPLASSSAISHLESQGMEDTLMDLSQDNSSRNVPVEVSPQDEPQEQEESKPVAGEEQGDFEGGPDLEGDAAAEFDLLGDDDQDAQQGEQQTDQDMTPSTQTAEEAELAETQPTEASSSQLEDPTSQPPVSLTPGAPSVPAIRPQVSRRGSGASFPRGRGLSREDPRMIAAPSPNRPVPITWTPSPAQPNPRVFRRAPVVVASPPAGIAAPVAPPTVVPPLLSEAPVGAVPSPMRGRGQPRGRPRRAGRHL